jgi:formylglycine-generating enzyme required for sulfatase activity
VHGNVREWVWDHYAHYDEAPQIDPFGPLREEERIIRGGSWDDDAQDCRSALRLSAFPNEASATLGFRVAITIE